jgi:SAM-dependent methyltransferase
MTVFSAEEKVRLSQEAFWTKSWADENFSPPWRGRGAPPELVEALQEGWFPATGRALDIGCGEGAIAAWLCAKGYTALGLDIAAPVIEMACARHISAANQKALNFLTLDITQTPPPGAPYNMVIDRGCLHAIHSCLVEGYVRNIAAVCSPDARMLLYVKAFRGDEAFNDPRTMARHRAMIGRTFAGVFEVVSATATNIGQTAGEPESQWLPGIVFRLQRA